MTNPRNEFEFQVSGRYAMYTTPQSKCSGDKSSYPVPTYEALKGLVKKIYWKPTFEVEIIKVRVMNQSGLSPWGCVSRRWIKTRRTSPIIPT